MQTPTPPWHTNNDGQPAKRSRFPKGVKPESRPAKRRGVGRGNARQSTISRLADAVGMCPYQCLAAALLEDALGDAQLGDAEARAFLDSPRGRGWMSAITPAGRDVETIHALFTNEIAKADRS